MLTGCVGMFSTAFRQQGLVDVFIARLLLERREQCSMLNSNVHNPEIQKHQVLSEDEFIRSNSGIDGGKDIPRPILQELYHSVINHEFHALHEPDGIDDYYIMSEIYVENVQKNHSTKLTIDKMEVDLGVKASLFQEKNLKRLPR